MTKVPKNQKPGRSRWCSGSCAFGCSAANGLLGCGAFPGSHAARPQSHAHGMPLLALQALSDRKCGAPRAPHRFEIPDPYQLVGAFERRKSTCTFSWRPPPCQKDANEAPEVTQRLLTGLTSAYAKDSKRSTLFSGGGAPSRGHSGGPIARSTRIGHRPSGLWT